MATEAKPAGMLLLVLLLGILVSSTLGPSIRVSAQSSAGKSPNGNEKVTVLWWAKPVMKSKDFRGLSTPVGVYADAIPSFIDLDLVRESDTPPRPLSSYDVLVIDDTSFPPGLSSFRGRLVVTIDGGISTLLYHLTGDTREDGWWTFASIPSILWIGAMEKGTVETVSPSDDAMIYRSSLSKMASHGIELVGGPLAVDSSNQSQISVALFNVTKGGRHFLWLFLGPYDRSHPDTPRRQTEIIMHFISVLLYLERAPPSLEVRKVTSTEFVLSGLGGTIPLVKMDLNLALNTPVAGYLEKFAPRIQAKAGSGETFDSELELHDGDLVTSLSMTVPIHPLENNSCEVDMSVLYSIGGETFILHSDKVTFIPTHTWSDSPTIQTEIEPSGDGSSFNVRFSLPKPSLEAEFEGDRLQVKLKYPVNEYVPLLRDKEFGLRVEDEETLTTILDTEITLGERTFPLNLSSGSHSLRIILYDGPQELQTVKLRVEAPIPPTLIGGVLAVVAAIAAVVLVKFRRRGEAEELERILEEGEREEGPLPETPPIEGEGGEMKEEIVESKEIEVEQVEEIEPGPPKKPVVEEVPEEASIVEEPKGVEELGNLILTTPSGSSVLIDTTTTVRPGDLSVKGEGRIHFSKTVEGWMMEVEGVDAELNGERLEENRPYKVSDGDKLVVWGLEVLIQIV